MIDFLTQDFTKEDAQYDFVLDAVGKSTFGACKPILKPDGVYISAELGPGNENVYLALLAPLLGRSRKRVLFPLPLDIKGSLARMRDLVEAGQVPPRHRPHLPPG